MCFTANPTSTERLLAKMNGRPRTYYKVVTKRLRALHYGLVCKPYKPGEVYFARKRRIVYDSMGCASYKGSSRITEASHPRITTRGREMREGIYVYLNKADAIARATEYGITDRVVLPVLCKPADLIGAGGQINHRRPVACFRKVRAKNPLKPAKPKARKAPRAR